MNPNDEIRQLILQYLYDRNANATSQRGKKGSQVRTSAIKSELKDIHGLKQQQVMSNLPYLIDNGWAADEDVEVTVNTPGGQRVQATTYYRITAKGIDKIEGGSQFEPKERYAGININATGQNIITLGDGNVVNAEFSDLHAALTELKEAVSATEELREDEKLDAAADIETIKDQLAKQTPNKKALAGLWEGLQRLANAATVGEAFAKVAGLIAPLL